MSLFDKLRPLPVSPEVFGGAGLRRPFDAAAASVFQDFGHPYRDGVAAAEHGTGGTPAAAEPLPADELERATQAAYAAGVADGKAEAEQELRTLGEALAAALADVARFRRLLSERSQGEVLELALGIARKVVQRELAEHPEHWLAMIREAIRHSLDKDRIRIRVGGVLHRFLLERLPQLRAVLEEVRELELVEDDSLPATACVLESQSADLDLSLDSQIGALRAALSEVA